jgi:uncharacterized membrane protein
MSWPRRILLVLAGAALTHVVAIWAVPRIILSVVQHRLARGVGINQIHHAPLPDAEWRTIVMPSPDLLYSACAYDVSNRPLLITAELPEGYWSVSAFANNTDNFFVQNDRTASNHRARVVFSSQPDFRDPGGGTVVQVPSKTGIILFRQLVLDRENLPKAQTIQRAATCAPL